MTIRSFLAAAAQMFSTARQPLFLAGFASLLLSSCASAPQRAVTLSDLNARLRSAYSRQSYGEAAKVLAEVASRFPNALSQVPDDAIMRLAAIPPSSNAAERAARFELLQKLFALGWKDEHGIEPSTLWHDLIRELIERDRVDEAVRVVPHVQSPGQMIELRVDKRFDVLMQKSAPVLSVEGIAKANVQNWRQANAKFPRSIEVVVGLLSALYAAGKFDTELALANEAAARVESAKSPRDAFDDADQKLNWLYNSRASALQALGRWDEAVADLRKARDLLERGGPNVSNTINLADLYVGMGRSDDALTTLAPLLKTFPKNTSPYGAMQVQVVRHSAAVLQNDEATARAAFEYLSKHRADSPRAFQEALVWSNRPDEWAHYMIERLHDPQGRNLALRELQSYPETPEPPVWTQMRNRMREFANRPDVRAAVAEVGVIERFEVPFSLAS
jgi:tetratricopeptide (TPR) repeat protein